MVANSAWAIFRRCRRRCRQRPRNKRGGDQRQRGKSGFHGDLRQFDAVERRYQAFLRGEAVSVGGVEVDQPADDRLGHKVAASDTEPANLDQSRKARCGPGKEFAAADIQMNAVVADQHRRRNCPPRPARIRSSARRLLPEPEGPRIRTARSPTRTAEAWMLGEPGGLWSETAGDVVISAAAPRSARRRRLDCRPHPVVPCGFRPRYDRDALR